MGLIGDHLRGLLRFAGREPRQPFWLWVLVIMALSMLSGMVGFFPLFFGTFGKIEQFAREHPDQVTRTVGPGSYSIQVHGYHPELMPDFAMFMGVMLIVTLLVIVLLAAAVARRLHDSGRSGWWGILPVPFLLVTFWEMSRLFALAPTLSDTRDAVPAGFFQLFGLTMISDLCYLGTLILLVVFCCMPTQPGDNRYGAGFERKWPLS
jgi:uncharacterized membrane protein YhaH (DUF805 family)